MEPLARTGSSSLLLLSVSLPLPQMYHKPPLPAISIDNNQNNSYTTYSYNNDYYNHLGGAINDNSSKAHNPTTHHHRMGTKRQRALLCAQRSRGRCLLSRR